MEDSRRRRDEGEGEGEGEGTVYAYYDIRDGIDENFANVEMM